MTPIALGESVEREAIKPPAAPPEPPPAPRVDDVPRRTAPARAAPPESVGPQEIVCPRCKLHFSPHRHKKSADAGSKKTVLVVEDQEYFREIARDALSPMFDVRSAANSDEARSALTHGDIDLLVLDLTLDGGDAGMDLLRELDPKPCPVLIFTAQDESELYGKWWDELRRAGADDLVIKGMQVAESLARKAGSLLGTPLDEEDTLR
jgi:CheY-like chemotaxis protein